MVWDADRRVIDWFERALTHEHPDTRIRALELLAHVDGPRRSRWLERGLRDESPRVRATAALVQAAVRAREEMTPDDILESDFAAHAPGSDLGWEWEYCFVPCRGVRVPTAVVRVWTAHEDDETARALAVLKASAGSGDADSYVAVMVDKRFVNRFTRSPRTRAEALSWRRHGRPRYRPAEG